MPRRKTFQEALALVPLPPAQSVAAAAPAARFMSTSAAWLPGSDLQAEMRTLSDGRPGFPVHTAAFGGHVYAQAVLAACRALDAAVGGDHGLGLHTAHGFFTAAGRADRPFVYEAAVLTRGRSFVTARVEARQPTAPSRHTPAGALAAPDDAVFGPDDAARAPLGVVCFAALVSFVLPRPHSFGADAQEAPVQARFAAVLAQRAPAAWMPAPPIDIEVLVAALDVRAVVGSFPLVDMKKVDLRAYNDGRPLHERRELVLYRLLGPLPAAGAGGVGAATALNSHVLVHAYAADRNGLLMAANHLDFPLSDKTATLSNSFVVHTNVADAQMAFRPHAETDGDLRAWWVQEVCFPRAAAGRAIVHSKIWSPAGVHVATEYQDGLCTAMEEAPFDFAPKL